MAKRGYSVTEVAEMFGVTRATIHNWLDEGANRFPSAYSLGDSKKPTVVIPPQDIQKVIKEEMDKYQAKIEMLEAIEKELNNE